MTLPASGPLSLSVINTEFGRGTNLNAYRGTGWYTDAGGSGTFSSGAISVSEFYNKRLTSPQFSFTISSNQTNANLRTLAINAGWNQSSKVVATINSGVYISSNSTGTPAITVSGSFPGGVELVNNGYIVGMGGAGGTGNHQGSGYVGASGGGALSVSTGVQVRNNGTIGGGGGGGGGGGRGWVSPVIYSFQAACGNGGGGGRTGTTNSSGGGRTSGSFGGVNGNPGTLSSGGAQANSGFGGFGGAGGSWGSNGSGGGTGATASYTSDSGTFTQYGSSGGGGGGAGYAVSGNGNITWLATGTRLGSIG